MILTIEILIIDCHAGIFYWKASANLTNCFYIRKLNTVITLSIAAQLSKKSF